MRPGNRFACAAVLSLTAALNAQADWYAYFGVTEALFRVRLDSHCDPEPWAQEGERIEYAVLNGNETSLLGICDGHTMYSTDLCVPNRVSEVGIRGLKETYEVFGVASDNETLVLDAKLEGANEDKFLVVLLDLKTLTIKSSIDSNGAICLPNNRILFFPRNEPKRVYSCDLNGSDKRLEFVFTEDDKGDTHFRDAFLFNGALCELREGKSWFSVHRAKTDVAAKPQEIVKVSGNLLCRAGKDMFYRSLKNKLCLVNLDNPKQKINLTDLAAQDLFSKEDTRTPGMIDMGEEPRVSGGMEDIKEAYPSPDGTKLLFFNYITNQLPMECRAFDVPTKTWSEKSIIVQSGLGKVFVIADPCKGKPAAQATSSAKTTQSR